MPSILVPFFSTRWTPRRCFSEKKSPETIKKEEVRDEKMNRRGKESSSAISTSVDKSKKVEKEKVSLRHTDTPAPSEIESSTSEPQNGAMRHGKENLASPLSTTPSSSVLSSNAINDDKKKKGSASLRKSHSYTKYSRESIASILGARALAAGGGGGSSSAFPIASSSSEEVISSSLPPTLSSSSMPSRTPRESKMNGRREVDIFRHGVGNQLLDDRLKYLVIGDGMMAPFMALSLRVHGIHCNLLHFPSTHPSDRGTIVLTPSITQLMGDVLNVSVPSGSVIGRLLVFDHVGNDMCDLDLNEFREKGESPTFFCCDRLKVENALLSLCRVGLHSCHVWSHSALGSGGSSNSSHAGEPFGKDGADRWSRGAGGITSPSSLVQLEALPHGGVRVRFTHSGITQDYLGVICTARNQSLVPELTLNNEELQQRAENAEKYRENMSKAPRWMELCVPPLPELGKFEKRFTPGSQEIVEIITPRDAKLTVRPTMLATKLFYHVTMTIPDATADPTLRSTSTKVFWDEVAQHWTAGVPGYISHTLFRPLYTHLQQHFSKSSALVYSTPFFLLPYWSEGNGRVLRVAHAAHSAAFDAIDVSDAQGFTDCFRLARVLSESGSGMGTTEDVSVFLKQRRLEVMEELEHHSRLLQYGLKERGQFGFMCSRFGMKILRRYKKSWKSMLQNYVSLLPKRI